MNALSVRGLTKTYKNGVQALQGVDLDVEQGDFFALLGPNGAGKTTLIGIITSLVNKTAGTARVFDHDIDRELEAAKACIGVVPQELNFNMFESPVHDRRQPGRLLRHPAAGGARARREVPEAAAAVGQAQRHVARPVRRHEAAPDDRARAHARAAPADPGRAHRRGGHRDPPLHVGLPARDQRRAAPPSSSPRTTSRRPRPCAATSPSSAAGASSSATA